MSIFLSLAFGVAFVMVLFGTMTKNKGSTHQLTIGDIKRKNLLTANESEFLTRLEIAAPEFRFHAQVCMGALLEPSIQREKNVGKFMSIRGRFSQKIVDFVAQRKLDGEIIAIIELDDRTHIKSKDEKRDQMLEMAGYRVLRWQSKSKPNPMDIRATLLQVESSGISAG